jgi:hypothetical protein
MPKSLEIATNIENCIQSLPENPTIEDIKQYCMTFNTKFYHIIGVAKLTHLLTPHEQYLLKNY